MMKDFKSLGLPVSVKVKVKKGVSGNLLIEMPELDTFTECEGKEEVEEYVNDLIMTYFDVPPELRQNIYYS